MLRPVKNKIALRPVEGESILELPANAVYTGPYKVMAIGPDVECTGIGETVLVYHGSGHTFEVGGEKYRVVTDDDIAVVIGV